ncbi:hypothetical protein Poly59_39010 [Rubripirellula reticaptiva]|uniref:Uncharacterized protein n=1 Tax=Rubripirellula reticaptiva TaxID=2528013 RepID=A0A5C6EMC2_9BACT|nr:hypothetical protein Poly59_39010 [Rubripirellula reticaptiva]
MKTCSLWICRAGSGLVLDPAYALDPIHCRQNLAVAIFRSANWLTNLTLLPLNTAVQTTTFATTLSICRNSGGGDFRKSICLDRSAQAAIEESSSITKSLMA